MSMKGGLLNKDLVIFADEEISFHPYTFSWHGLGDYGFFVGLGPLPTKGKIGYKDFFCALNETGNIYKIEKYDKGFYARPKDDKIKDYLEKREDKIWGKNANFNEAPLNTLDKFLNDERGLFGGYYYIHSYDKYNPVSTVTGVDDGFKLLTHKIGETTKIQGGKRKTRRVKKSNRKSNRKRRSNTKRHTRKH